MAHLGLSYVVARPTYEERDLALAPAEESLAHARGKVESVAPQFLDAIIIGSDQLLFWEGRRHRKPITEHEVIVQLLELRGIEHHLFTSLVVRDMRQGESLEHVVDSTLVIDGGLSDRQIKRYVRNDKPAGCAGGYRLEARGISLFSRISTSDASAILGLPLLSLCTFLRHFEVSIP
jgi:septum formation protein